MPRQQMQARVTQVVEPLPRSRRFWEDTFHQPSRFQCLHMAIDRGAAGPPGYTHHQVVGPLQGIAQQPVQEPPIDIGKGLAYLSQAPHAVSLRRVRRRSSVDSGIGKRPFPRPLVRVMMRLHPLPGTSDGGATEPLLPASCCDRHCRASSDVVRCLPLLLHRHCLPPFPLPLSAGCSLFGG